MARRKNVLRLTLVIGLAVLLSACHYQGPRAHYYGGYYGQGHGYPGHHHSKSYYGHSW